MGEFYFPEATFRSFVSSHHDLFASSQATFGYYFVVSVGHNSTCFVLVECNVSLVKLLQFDISFS